VSEAPDEIAPESHARAGRRSSRALTLILLLLVAAAGASFLYNLVRQDIEQKQAAIAATGGDPDQGALLIARFGCAGCHVIPGVDGASGQVGPELGGVARRTFVAGVVPNTVDNLIRFIVDPQSVDEKSAMPVTGINGEQARDVAAYLYSIRQ
jgi:cytochrome c